VEVMFAKSHSKRGLQNIFRRSSVIVVVVRDDVETRVALNGKKMRWNRYFWMAETRKIAVNLKES
jgi:hypothetical protein